MAATKHASELSDLTKECITTTVLLILKTNRLDAMTVSLVCKKAGVSRAGFYRHFKNIEQVLYDYFTPYIKSSFELIKREQLFSERAKAQRKFFDEYGELFRLAEIGGYEYILRDIFIGEIRHFFAGKCDDYTSTFMATGTYEVWRKWIVSNEDVPLEEIMRILRRFNNATE